MCGGGGEARSSTGGWILYIGTSVPEYSETVAGARKRELAQSPELLGGSETADLARDRRRRSWKVLGNGGAGPGLGDGGADSGPGDGGSLPGLGDSEAGQGSETVELTRIRRQRGWKALGDGGGAGTGLETAELARGRRPELVRFREQWN